MGRVKDYYWDEIEALAQEDYFEPDYEAFEAQVTADIAKWAEPKGLNAKDPDVVDQYWSEYLNAD